MKYDLITILGATAGGKTPVAAQLALKIDGEVISADSRQVYRGMDIGTGKDLDDYVAEGKKIPYHLIDIADAGSHYNVYEFQRDFLLVYDDIRSRKKVPVLCGGTGLYIEAVTSGYKLISVPVNQILRERLSGMTLSELSVILAKMKKLHNTTDIDTKKRAIRAIEIEQYYSENPPADTAYPDINSLYIGIAFDRETRRRRITERLKLRLENGMIDEAEKLLKSGLTTDQLIYYGLEYKYLAQYLAGFLSYDEMFTGLETAIHRFAKRQMTWFRGMERKGIKIHWIDGTAPMEEKLEHIIKLMV